MNLILLAYVMLGDQCINRQECQLKRQDVDEQRCENIKGISLQEK